MRILIAAALVASFLVGCTSRDTGESPEDLAAARADIQSEVSADNESAEMIRVLGLDATQSAALESAFAARDEAVSAWLNGEKGTQLVALEADLARAARAQNLAAVKKITSQAGPLRNELRGLFKSHEREIFGALTPDQQVDWQGHEVSRKLLELARPLQLDGQQVAAIEQAGPSAVAQAIQQGEPNPKAAAFLELEQWVEGSVLSDAQAAAYEDVKSENKLRSLGI